MKRVKCRLNKDYILKQLVSYTLRSTKLILKSVLFSLEKGSFQGQVLKKSVSENSGSIVVSYVRHRVLQINQYNLLQCLIVFHHGSPSISTVSTSHLYTQQSVLFYKSLSSNVNLHISKAFSVDMLTHLFAKYDRN